MLWISQFEILQGNVMATLHSNIHFLLKFPKFYFILMNVEFAENYHR
jgi:hypothetical protein